MNAKKQRDKNRRRASRLAQQAWEAADDDNFDLAVKIIRRAVELNPANPVLWNDQGTLLLQLHEDDKAARSFQTAIQAAPDFAEAYAEPGGNPSSPREGGTGRDAATRSGSTRTHVRTPPRHLGRLRGFVVAGCSSDARIRTRNVQTHLDEGRIEQAPSSGLPDLASRIESLDLAGARRPIDRARPCARAGAAACRRVRNAADDVRRGPAVCQDGDHEQESIWKGRLSLLCGAPSPARRCHPPI